MARALSLDYYTLKEKAAAAGVSPGELVSPAFVELRLSSSDRVNSGVTIELHSESGDRMTMRLPMLDGLDAVELVQAF
ncbi:MAG: hypothetical protein O2857_17420, partial [Planctomycetota bacterium]|nr:hypothetical protein [Planctomycetota bacterium]